ncbi:MAG: hypothetical protein HXY27_04310 [Hydrogenophilaceae bacterium]|nr:hypothetical protein [Hydrogenophilaceae bacterium]
MPANNRMPNFASGGFPAPLGMPQIHPMAVRAPFLPVIAGFPAPWGMPQMAMGGVPNPMPPVISGFPPVWGVPGFPMPSQGKTLLPATAMIPLPAPMDLPAARPHMPMPVSTAIAASPNFWNLPAMAHQVAPTPQTPAVAMTMQAQPQSTVVAPSMAAAPSAFSPVDTKTAMNPDQASVPTQAKMDMSQVNQMTQANRSETAPIEVQSIEPPMMKSGVSLKDFHLSTAGAPEKPVVEQSPISPVEVLALQAATGNKAEADQHTAQMAPSPAKAEKQAQSMVRAYPMPPVVGEAAFPSMLAVAKPSAPLSQASESREHQGGAAVEEVAATRKLKVSDPCSERFRPIRSKVKRPKGKLMKTRKPAYDPCKGRYKAIRTKTS